MTKEKNNAPAGNESAMPLKRRRGRPRKDEADREARREEIVNAAIRLFADRSYHDITMSDIAHAVGMNQSSLYYWFKDKEDVLGGILKDSAVSSELAKRLAAMPDDHALHLYAVVYTDTKMMCEFPCDYYNLEEVALGHPARFEPFFDTYGTLRQTIEQIVRAGIESGDFRNHFSPTLTTNIVLSLTEGLQHQYHQSKAMQEETMHDAWGSIVLKSTDELARLAADTALLAVAPSVDTEKLYNEAVVQELI